MSKQKRMCRMAGKVLLVTRQIGQVCFRYPMSQNIHS